MDPFFGIAGAMVGIYIAAILAFVFGTVFWIVELVDVARREFTDPILKLVWLLVILFTHVIGSLVYYFVGKRQGFLPGERPYGGYPPY